MKKTFCDRCGKEMGDVVVLDISQAEKLIAGIRYTLTSRFGMGDAKQYDLCPECQRDLYDWLNDGDKEDNTEDTSTEKEDNTKDTSTEPAITKHFLDFCKKHDLLFDFGPDEEEDAQTKEENN